MIPRGLTIANMCFREMNTREFETGWLPSQYVCGLAMTAVDEEREAELDV